MSTAPKAWGHLPTGRAPAMEAVLAEIRKERARQDTIWGEQNHPDGTGGPGRVARANAARLACQSNAERGKVTYLDILDEEVAEAFAEVDPARLREELIQVAAVCVAWVEKIDRHNDRRRTV